MASRPRVRHWDAISLAVSAARWCSAAASRARRTAWREMHDTGVGHAHSGGPLRIGYMRVESEAFRRIEGHVTHHPVEVRGAERIRVRRARASGRSMETERVRPTGTVTRTCGRCGLMTADGGLRGHWHRFGDEGLGGRIITRVVPEIRGDDRSCPLRVLSS